MSMTDQELKAVQRVVLDVTERLETLPRHLRIEALTDTLEYQTLEQPPNNKKVPIYEMDVREVIKDLKSIWGIR